MSKSIKGFLPNIKKRFGRAKRTVPSPTAAPSTQNLCHHCDAIVHSDTSGFFPHINEVKFLKISAEACDLCRLLLASLDHDGEEQDDYNRIIDRMDQRRKIVEATGKDEADLEGAKRNATLIVNELLRQLTIECTMHSGCHDECQHGKTLFGRKIAFYVDPGPEPKLTTPMWNLDGEEILQLAERIPTILRWMSDCTSSHVICHSPKDEAPEMPTRVLDVGNDDDNNSGVRLVETKGQMGRYIALSHCWGNSKPSTTTKSTLADRLQGIPLQDLTKTIQHAILVTRMLGLRYIWIDSLCIVQDSPADWQHEAGLMAAVYRNANLTIAATTGSGSQADLIQPPVPTTHIAIGPYESIHARFERDFKKDVSESPLATRGWTLQEMVLSRRVLHFAKEQLYWECTAIQASEDGLLHDEAGQYNLWFDVPKMLTSFESSDHIKDAEALDALRINWRAVAETYSRRRLTYQSDKLAALAGITHQMQVMLQDDPIVGLWKNDILNGLLWVRHISVAPRVPKDLLIPSWSWLSIAGGINYAGLSIKKTATQTMQVLQADVRWTGAEHTSSLSGVTLKVRAKVRSGCILRLMPPVGDHENRYRIQSIADKNYCLGSCFLDASSTPVDQPVWCAEIQFRDSHDGSDIFGRKTHTRSFDVLVLQPVDLERRRFVRVGLGEFEFVISRPHSTSYNEKDPFEGTETMDLYLE